MIATAFWVGVALGAVAVSAVALGLCTALSINRQEAAQRKALGMIMQDNLEPKGGPK